MIINLHKFYNKLYYLIKITDFIELSKITSLVDLRMSGNPILYKDQGDETWHCTWSEIVSTFPQLIYLNSSKV